MRVYDLKPWDLPRLTGEELQSVERDLRRFADVEAR